MRRGRGRVFLGSKKTPRCFSLVCQGAFSPPVSRMLISPLYATFCWIACYIFLMPICRLLLMDHHLYQDMGCRWRYVMSSLDKLPDWTVFTKREVPFVCEMLSPASEVSALLQDRQIALETTRREIEVVRQAGLAALAQQAVYVVQLEKVLEQIVPGETQPGQNAQSRNYRRLRIVQEQMLTALKEVGLEVIIPKGK